MNGNWTIGRSLLHCWVVATAALTFVLLCSGGLVTSHGVGLAVPDWPNSFGYNMFTFPVSRWVGGIFFEHSHRLIATFVGLFTAILAVWLWVRETSGVERTWGVTGIVAVVLLLGIREMPVYLTLAILAPFAVAAAMYWHCKTRDGLRWLGLAALSVVVLQGVLGGLRVVWLKDQIGIFHALLAQSFFVLITILAVMTGRRYAENRWAAFEPDASLRRWTLAATALIFLQLALGATMRHEHIGLSIPDFPLAYGQVVPETSPAALTRINAAREAAGEMPTTAMQIWIQMAHRGVAVLILATVLILAIRARRASRSVRFWSFVWLAMISLQIGLGAWTIWSNKAADVATAHMALGALSLLTGALIAFRLLCGARVRDFALPDLPRASLMERIA